MKEKEHYNMSIQNQYSEVELKLDQFINHLVGTPPQTQMQLIQACQKFVRVSNSAKSFGTLGFLLIARGYEEMLNVVLAYKEQYGSDKVTNSWIISITESLLISIKLVLLLSDNPRAIQAKLNMNVIHPMLQNKFSTYFTLYVSKKGRNESALDRDICYQHIMDAAKSAESAAVCEAPTSATPTSPLP